jgi:hypothetical protein
MHFGQVRLLQLVALASLGACVTACDVTVSGPDGASAATAPAPVATRTPLASGGATVRDATGLDTTPAAKMCGLLRADEATAILGTTVAVTPTGTLLSGLGTNCVYQTGSAMAPGTFIKVEIDPISYRSNVGIVTLGGAPSSQIVVLGFDATALDVSKLQVDAALVVRLTDPDKSPSMLIQAPTLDAAKAAAEKILGRLDTLK